jgi:redox-sensitive bicupin YhaK (pirin superfamily)
MTAASGVLHKEYHEEEFSKKGGEFQMVQLWVNLPAKDKMSKPKYQGITNAGIGKHQLPDNNGVIEVIAGQYKDVKGAASTFTPVHLLNAKLNKGAKADFSFPMEYNSAVLVLEGSVKVNGESAKTNNFVVLKNDGEDFLIEAAEDSVVLVLSGEPIAYGPFVMNTQEEIRQAIDDVNMGRFGYLEE